ncbi:IS4 family transposase [Pseudomonas saliphila]|uniref:IS4 family transposase n=1 Tax=Pseudomonas saliphila TaxID=2586906 RepID=UPI001238E662|nr:IS4 family transposase [Pseudomonas saliphila]
MHPRRRAAIQQQRCAQRHAKEADSYTFFDLLSDPKLLDSVEPLIPRHRERLFPPTETLSLFLAQAMSADASCQKVVNDTVVDRVKHGLNTCSTRTGAYCRARQRLPTGMVSTLCCQTGRLMADAVPQTWQWNGRPVRLVDGTTISMPDTQANQEAYPQPRSQKPGLGFPQCRLVGIVCLASGAVLNAAVGRCRGKGGDEQTLLRGMLSTLSAGGILLGDSFYATYFLFVELQRRQVDGVFEQHGVRQRSTNFEQGRSLGPKDHLIEITKPKQKPDWMSREYYDQAPESLTVRELFCGGKVLVTTLLNAKHVPKAELNKLYRSRWHVELDLRNLKSTLGLDTLSCKTPSMAIKELWVYVLAHNLIRLLMSQSALLGDCLPRELSFKHTLQLWNAWRQSNADGSDEDYLASLFFLIAEQRVGNRPQRIEPRAIKRRPRTFPLLTQPRPLARKQVARNGHPKKVK